MIYTAAFMIGLMGSLHCIGMCGPLALALPVRTNNTWIKIFKYLLYNLGRIITYTIIGMFTGIAGIGLALAGLQEIISVVTGGLIIISVLIVHNPIKINFLNKLLFKIKEKLRRSFQFYFQEKGIFSIFILGLLNGLLPCGMVYVALLGSLSAGSILSSAGFMAAFGIGTLPLMLAISIIRSSFNLSINSLLKKSIPFIGCMVGVLLIMRGLHINYVPQIFEKSCCNTRSCH